MATVCRRVAIIIAGVLCLSVLGCYLFAWLSGLIFGPSVHEGSVANLRQLPLFSARVGDLEVKEGPVRYIHVARYRDDRMYVRGRSDRACIAAFVEDRGLYPEASEDGRRRTVDVATWELGRMRKGEVEFWTLGGWPEDVELWSGHLDGDYCVLAFRGSTGEFFLEVSGSREAEKNRVPWPRGVPVPSTKRVSVPCSN
jgi:hypothetical protein